MNLVDINNAYLFGGVSGALKDRRARLFNEVKLGALSSGLPDAARAAYKSSWLALRGFFFVRFSPICLSPGPHGWDGALLFLNCASGIFGMQSSALRGRFSAIRFTHLIDGDVDLSLQSHSAKSTINGLEKREGVARKPPFNTYLLRWARKELVGKTAPRSLGRGSMHLELYAACILGFFYILCISELEYLKWEDASVDTNAGKRYLSIRTKQSKTDVSRDGILRSLIEIDAAVCHVGAFIDRGKWLPIQEMGRPCARDSIELTSFGHRESSGFGERGL